MNDATAFAALYQRASEGAAAGRFEDAKRDYLAALQIDPRHFGVLNDFATLLYGAQFRTAARTLYAEAVRLHPDNPMGRINLGNALLADEDLVGARAEFEAALRRAPEHPDAHQGMANLLHHMGDHAGAQSHLRRSLAGRTIIPPTAREGAARVRVLCLVSAAGGNVPTRHLLGAADFATSVLAVESFTRDQRLPPHDLVFNAVGDADLGPEACDAAQAVIAQTRAPVINPPDRVRRTGRAETARRLATAPGVVTPAMRRAGRAEIGDAAAAVGFPLLVRSPGHHTGRFFVRVEAPSDLEAALVDLPGDSLLVIGCLDAQGADGWTRKYRVMVVGGDLFPLHLAMSRDWKVHYFTAAMAAHPEHRAEEAAFLRDMTGALGPRAMDALHDVAARLGIDYGGVDFALGPAGEILLFEANATMVVAPPDPDPMWDYRRGAVERVTDAVHAMLLARAAAPQPRPPE